MGIEIILIIGFLAVIIGLWEFFQVLLKIEIQVTGNLREINSKLDKLENIEQIFSNIKDENI
jgi:hypothetical protein